MPKILINEKDKTSPGAPNSYSNYAVLLAGFMGRDPVTLAEAEADSTLTADRIQPDSNGIYEFSALQDFIETIGVASPKQIKNVDAGQRAFYHYGNQMAYELLNMGYSIVYKPITAETIADLAKPSFWEIFKDKVSYDFRFITHGLLESSLTTEEAEQLEDLESSKTQIEAAITALKNIEKAAEEGGFNDAQEADPTLEKTVYLNNEYIKIRDSYNGFIIAESELRYETYSAAKEGTEEALENVDTDIKALLVGQISDTLINNANGCIADLAMYKADGESGRGDCIALIELDEKKYLKTSSTEKAEILICRAISEMSTINETNGTYSAMTVPSVVYNMTDNDFKNKKFPGAFHYLACFMKSLRMGYNEWYAAAGYTRGVSDYTVKYTTVKLGEIAINALEPRNKADSNAPKFACNVIANFRGSYYLWGNRTAHPLGDANSIDKGDLTAYHFLNIRQLCTTIKKQLYVACRRFTFDPNSDTLWVNFVNAIKPTLEAMKADQGIRDYKVLKVYEENPKKATLKAKIRIIPIEAVEDFDIEVSLEDSFGETAVTTN